VALEKRGRESCWSLFLRELSRRKNIKNSGALANFMLFECARAIDRFSNLLKKVEF